jgi:hypothetical protein
MPRGGGHDAVMLATEVTHEGAIDYMVFPLTLGLRSGTLRLAGGRLTYTRKRKRRVVFDAPVGEFHSFARAYRGTGFHLWHGSTRHRFLVYRPVLGVELGPSLAAEAIEGFDRMRKGLAQEALSRAEVDGWHDALVPHIAASAPPDVAVRRPLRGARFWFALLGSAVAVTLAFMAVVTAIVLASG